MTFDDGSTQTVSGILISFTYYDYHPLKCVQWEILLGGGGGGGRSVECLAGHHTS